MEIALQNLIGENAFTERKCEVCGRILTPVEVNIAGRIYKVVPACECEVKKYQEEKERLERKELDIYLESFFALSEAERYKDCSLENFEPREGVREAWEKVKQYIENLEENLKTGHSLFLFGDVGTGKSHLAFSIYNEAKNKHFSVVFNTVSNIMNRLDKTFTNKEAEFDLLELLKIADLLVLDDLGVEVENQRSKERLHEIIAGRYNGRKATIITTNLKTQSEIIQWLGARIFDRLLETSTFIRFSGKSYRQEKRNGK
ncbi:MAG TPA: ATP-binding protein [Thermodesulfovibrio thiophilus]|nr:ATP-binding protein [Thermodesulfovibrio thiophilus]